MQQKCHHLCFYSYSDIALRFFCSNCMLDKGLTCSYLVRQMCKLQWEMNGKNTQRKNTGHGSRTITHLVRLQIKSRTHLKPAGAVVVNAQSFLQTTNVFVTNNAEEETWLLTSFEILRCLDVSGDNCRQHYTCTKGKDKFSDYWVLESLLKVNSSSFPSLGITWASLEPALISTTTFMVMVRYS